MHYAYANQLRIGKKLNPNYQPPAEPKKISKTKTVAVKRSAKEIKDSDEEDEIIEAQTSKKRDLKVKRKSQKKLKKLESESEYDDESSD